jgi:membrane associated rhomboid family serine protease
MQTLIPIVRMIAQAVIAFFLLGVVLGLASPNIGIAEKAVFAAIGVVLVGLALWLRKLQPPPPPNAG